MAIKAIVNNTEKEIEQIKNSDEQDIDYIYSRIGDTEVEGAPPISIKSIGGNLTDYRIYGNTVDGERVGDKTSNLFDEATAQNVTESVSVNKWVHIQVGKGTFTLSTNMPNIATSGFAANIFFLAGNVSTGANSVTNGVTDNTPITVSSSDGYVTVGLRNANSYNPKDYNIMLNTGSTVLPYEPYGYKVPVTVEGKNLWSGVVEQGSVSNTGDYGDNSKRIRSKNIPLEPGTYKLTSNLLVRMIFAYHDSTKFGKMFDGVDGSENPSFTVPEGANNISVAMMKLVDGAQVDITPEDFEYGQIEKGSEATPYEPYHVPATTPIYLPEQIKMVGDEAEYIDYATQKWHRVRKNLLKITLASAGATTYDGVSISNNDGILTLNGTSNNGTFVNLATAIKLPIGNYILTGGSENLMIRFQKTFSGYGYDDTGAGKNLNCSEEVTSGICVLKLTANYTYNNVKVYPMIRKADIEDDTYEPYITNTELDVTLPALSTIKGTNTFSVNTSIQPSNIYTKDNFDYKKVFTATRAIEDRLPLNYKSIEDSDSTLSNYRIYGNTDDGESVGDKTGNLFDEESAKIPGFVDNSGRINTSTVILDGVSTYGYMECSASTSYYLRAFTKKDPSSSSITQRVAFFDGNKDFISRELGASSFSFTTPENCSFIRLSLDDNYQNIVLMKGSTEPTEFIPYGYKVPVTVEGKNLFDNSKTANILKCYLSVSTLVSNVNTRTIFIECKPSTTYTVSKIRGERFVVGWSDKLPAPGVELQEKVINYNASSITITTGLTSKYLVAYIYNAEQDALITADEMIASVQIEKGSTATPYEPYHAPVTTPIYLPKQIKKVGSEAEYIDYETQKWHRVRKNLLQNTATSRTINSVTFTVNSDKSVTCNGTAIKNTFFDVNFNADTSAYFNFIENYILTGCPTGGSLDAYYIRFLSDGVAVNADCGSGVTINGKNSRTSLRIQITIAAGYTCDNLTFYPMIRKADITDDIYEPYIENTDLDVTLPALPTQSSTNSLSVGTEIEPSNIYIKGKIKSLD